MTERNDFTVQDEGSIVVVTPVTPAAKTWVAAHIPDDAQRWCGGVVIEQRYAFDVLEGIVNDGLVVGR